MKEYSIFSLIKFFLFTGSILLIGLNFYAFYTFREVIWQQLTNESIILLPVIISLGIMLHGINLMIRSLFTPSYK